MRVLDHKAAPYFCQGFAGIAGPPARKLDDFLDTIKGQEIREGGRNYQPFKDCLLREVDRYLLMAHSNFRRSHDSMTTESAYWAQTSLYYSAFFSAHAILGMLGAWVSKRKVVEVAATKPGRLQFTILTQSQREKLHGSISGSQAQFWHLYYDAIRSWKSRLSSIAVDAYEPVAGAKDWQTISRNTYNYEPYPAYEAMEWFRTSFDKTRFPDSLPGDLGRQFDVSQAMLSLARHFSSTFKVGTDAISLTSPAVTKLQRLDRAVKSKAAAVPISIS